MNPLPHPDAARPLLLSAAEGLLYVSESEAPFELIQDAAAKAEIGAHDARQLAGRAETEPVAEIPIARFFSDLTTSQPWHSEEETAAVERYRTLAGIFGDQLANARVFRVGSVQVTILILGRTANSIWVGLKTEAVET